MKQPIEDFIKANRAAFDETEVPADFMWEGVQSALAKKVYKKKINRWRIAAAVLAFLSLGQTAYLISGLNLDIRGPRPAHEQVEGGFLSLEKAYIRQVNALEQKVKEKGVKPEEYADLYEELSFINQVEEGVEEEIPLTNNKERIAEMLADTYEKKIQLLERLLQQIEREEKQQKALKAL
jgi:hypothetical protein